ncbi:hypothetical protein [Rhodococcus sp. Q]|uniref:hypothetical protein n=1 Tax=Rhodococcus sp. Q TaxID=2502252 RepID=UPI0010F69296|nr:hypothetical protein [Rhodococcus sp. Q]
MKKLLKSLSEKDFRLYRQTKRDRLRELDEDELIDLHARVRNARNKHMTVYRREAAAAVTDKAARGGARRTTGRNAARVEALETALARVSRRLGTVAKQNAAALKQERLDAARSDAPSFAGSGADDPAAARLPGGKTKSKQKSAGRKKREVSDIAAGTKRQAKRDSR